MQPFNVILLSVATLFQATHCLEYLIQSHLEFIQFVQNVNSGTDYQGDTVFLDKDLDFSGYPRFNPIGYTRDAFFKGVFFGQGHVLSNYVVNTTAQYAGIFGFTQGATINNLMVGPTCKIASTHKSYGTAYVGGIVAKCFSINKPCRFENMMTSAPITFSGEVGGDVAIGGVAGSCEFSAYHCVIKSCVNFGPVTGMGKVSWFTQIGGITGICDGSQEKRCRLHNNLNYGDLAHSGTSKDVIIGGIVGTMYGSTNIQNCVNAGKIVDSVRGRYNHIGALAGYAFDGDCSVERNFWAPEVGVRIPVGYNYTQALTVSATEETTLDRRFIETVNKRAQEHGWDTWILNMGAHNFSFVINTRLIYSTWNKISLLSDKAINEGYHSLGNFLDKGFTKPFDNFEITKDTVVYAVWARNPYTLTFVYNATIPDICDGASNESYAEVCGNITSGVLNTSMIVEFGKNFSFPLLPPKEGYVAMWCSEDRIVCDPPAMVAYDLALYPTYLVPMSSSSGGDSDSEIFNSTPSHYVRITFKLENMYTSEVEDVIRKYGGESVHEVLTISDVDLTTVVEIRFDNVDDAIEFVNGIRASKTQAHADKIEKVEYLDESLFSFVGHNSPFCCFAFWVLFCLFKVFCF